MPTTAQKVVLIGGGALVTYLVGRQVFAKSRTKPKPAPTPAPEPSPYDYTGLIDQFTSPPGSPATGTLYYQRGATQDAQGDWHAGDMWQEITKWALQNAGIPNTAANRIALQRLIECSPYNDALYGVKLSASAFGGRFRQDQPYGISGNAQHHDNLQRMKQGMPVRRAAYRHSMSDHETVPGGGRQAALWIPLLQQGIEAIGPSAVLDWQDGSSGINPPPEILALGFENVPAAEYGCAPWRMAVG
jgi:hypothetical protein